MFKNSKMVNMNVNNLGIAGGSTMSKTFSTMYNGFPWSKLIYIVIGIVLLVAGYYIYKNVLYPKTTYNANRENLNSVNDNNTNGKKQAELMLFYVDWCPHCKTAKPEWDSLKSTYENKTINGYSIIFTEHNCTNETPEVEELMNKYKIEGYPTIKLLKDNQIIEYDAKPTKSTMEQFLNTVL